VRGTISRFYFALLILGGHSLGILLSIAKRESIVIGNPHMYPRTLVDAPPQAGRGAEGVKSRYILYEGRPTRDG